MSTFGIITQRHLAITAARQLLPYSDLLLKESITLGLFKLYA